MIVKICCTLFLILWGLIIINIAYALVSAIIGHSAAITSSVLFICACIILMGACMFVVKFYNS